MKKWGIALSVIAVLCAAVLVLTLTGFWSPTGETKAAPPAATAIATIASGPVTVKQGEDAWYQSRDGSPEVSIPGTSLTGEGQLQITPVELSEGQKGWNIDLTGARLTGKATITFKNAVVSDRPVPLVGFNENAGDSIEYVRDVEVSGSDLIVRTEHFSNWLVDTMDWMREKMDKIHAGSGYGEQPVCEEEDKAREGVQVESDGGGAIMWCLGTNNGLNVLKVNNARGYAVSAERNPGLSISKRSMDSFGDMIPNAMAGLVTRPFTKGNTVDIIGPGETIEYRVHTVDRAKVRIDPSPPAYLATALWFAAQTTEMVYSQIYGKSVSIEQIGIAMDTADCVGGFQAMTTADVTNAQQAGKYLNDAMDAAMACSGRLLEDMAGNIGSDEVFLTRVADLMAWAWSGARTAAAGFGAAADTALNLDGYVIAISSDESRPGSQKEDALPLGANSELVGTWRGAVFGDQDGYDLVLELRESGGALSGTVSYPQLKCSGTWTELERDGDLIRFTERIDQDPDKTCVKTLTSRLMRTDAGLHVYIKRFWVEIEADLTKQ
ncbi:MAG: hypothetical protein ABWY04_10150 [Arthrobacter sp.]